MVSLVAEPLATVVVNGGAGALLAILGATLLVVSRGRAGKLLGAYLVVTGMLFVWTHASRAASDPSVARALLAVSRAPFYYAPLLLAAFASAETGIHQRVWTRGRAWPLALVPTALLLYDLAHAEDPPFAVFVFCILLLSGAFVYAVTLLALALRRESMPSSIPVRALLLAAFTIVAVNSVGELLFEGERWRWLPAGARPALLPDVVALRAAVASGLSLLPALLFLRASSRVRHFGLAALALAAVVTPMVVIAASVTDAEGGAGNIRWLLFALLVVYAALRHGYLGSRRVGVPLVEYPLAAAGFAALFVIFLLALQLYLTPAYATGLALGLALIVGAIVVGISEAPVVPSAEKERYVDQREIARGASGRVLLALDRRLHRDVVLKRLPRGERALAEARAAARVRHPALVAVHDVAEDDAGAYLVLEHVPGGTLEDRLRKEPLSPDETKRVALDLAAALAAVHEAGLVHGDIKAANVLLRDGKSAVLSDFGSARAAPQVEETLESLAREPVSGSLAGAAPETLEGASPDARADVYALGALLYRCLTGASYIQFPPDAADARDAIRREPPRLPHPRVPPRWDALLARCLSKDPAARPADGRALVATLAAVEG